ncbi:hypothetical protein F3Y22_tig00111057pilonHSYRG00024 [Hibiscus syriacus]|uniref:Uncharacterized protein n=1 Tax=Hibiscus syriacus TaxID=106335 RepID=A0A6A2Z628_HIBSY|nr:hypothetical protein F3Y22_tig00111057pilonHSYRG00024 [Hibiscus syriacus]
MSTQAEQQQQQPVVVYPSSVTYQTAPASDSDPSGGSFVAVFIVVAIIIATSAISCFLGRFCSRQISQRKPAKVKQSHTNLGPGEANIEFGSDGRINPGDHGETNKGLDFKMPGNGGHREFRVSEHVEPAEFRVPGNGYPELRLPENGDYVRFRMPGNDDPIGFRMTGHGDFNGETKPVDDGSGALKAGA